MAAALLVAYSGDNEWTEVLPETARGADLCVCEAYFFEKAVPHYLSYATLCQRHRRSDCRRLVVTSSIIQPRDELF